MQIKSKNKLSCPNCNGIIGNNSKFCSHCGVKINTINEMVNALAEMVINTASETKNEEGLLKTLGFKPKLTEDMKTELLIWYMFAVNMVIQEKNRSLNDIFHNAVIANLNKNKKEDFLKKLHARYAEYYNAINSKDPMKMIDLNIIFLENFIFGKSGNNKFPKDDQAYFAAAALGENFSRFLNFVRSEFFERT